MGGDPKAERRQVDAGKHCFASPEHDWRNGKVYLVDQARLKILAHCADTAADLDIPATGRRLGLHERYRGGHHERHRRKCRRHHGHQLDRDA